MQMLYFSHKFFLKVCSLNILHMKQIARFYFLRHLICEVMWQECLNNRNVMMLFPTQRVILQLQYYVLSIQIFTYNAMQSRSTFIYICTSIIKWPIWIIEYCKVDFRTMLHWLSRTIRMQKEQSLSYQHVKKIRATMSRLNGYFANYQCQLLL